MTTFTGINYKGYAMKIDKGVPTYGDGETLISGVKGKPFAASAKLTAARHGVEQVFSAESGNADAEAVSAWLQQNNPKNTNRPSI